LSNEITRIGKLRPLLQAWRFFRISGNASPATVARKPLLKRTTRKYSSLKDQHLGCYPLTTAPARDSDSRPAIQHRIRIHSNAMQYPGGADFEELAPFSARARRSLVCWDSVTSGLVGFNSIVIVRCWSGFGVYLSVIGATAAGGAVPGCQCPRPWTGRRNPPHPPIRGRSGENGGRRRRRSLSCPQRPGGRRR
jgi:hypothetical protein